MKNQKTKHKKKPLPPTAVTMNDDLKQWLSAEKQPDISKTINAKSTDQKPTGKCSICRVHQAKAICIKCKNPVCTSHFFSMVGLCQNCLSQQSINKWKNKKTDWKKILKVDWVD